ncbi:serine/arginine-rich splicing factor 7-like isoform X1 [Diorhabda carinulata]|uniref:serine/arginine-rich splicing factor 7-like isoform X1 n=1 Tax=Diorhabda sublineata TaxID=1163346 RepID=UPI0024E07E38|nr:serine/arginine-rich splicing factor 7-like isoform X1 [Diorhabda sublineata]XP_057651211.1 serine/arginine-rich splicing factor 7-like isoform X1 [Diorhabda carinulata]
MRDSPDSTSKRSRSKSSNSSTSRKSRSRSASSVSRSRSRSRSSEIDGYRLHIADIGDEVRRSDLEKLFTPYGCLKEVWMTNSTPCFGFAVFTEKKAAAAALKACDGAEVAGCRIHVTYARPRTRGSGRRFYSSNMRCYQCGYTGHFYRDCPDINGGDKRDRYGRSRRDRDRDSRRRSSRSGRYDDRSRRSGGASSRRRR